MAPLRTLARAVRPSTSTSTSATRQSRALSSTPAVRSGGESHFNPPGGLLFGQEPGKYQKQGWENIMIYGYGGAILLGIVGYAFKPDTSIQTWALEEARRRLEAEGILKDSEAK